MLPSAVGILAEAGSNTFIWHRMRAVLERSGAPVVKFVERPTNTRARKLRDIPARIAWRALNAAERAEPSFERFDESGAIALACTFRGHFKDFDPGAIELVRRSGVQLILRLGGRGVYRDAILDAAPHGLVSIHHGDNRRYRGSPPGFWEVMNGEPECGFIVQRLTRTLDAGHVLARGAVANTGSVTGNRKALFDAADSALAGVVAEFLRTHRLPPPEPAPDTLGPLYRMPGLTHIARYLARSRAAAGAAR